MTLISLGHNFIYHIFLANPNWNTMYPFQIQEDLCLLTILNRTYFLNLVFFKTWFLFKTMVF